MNCKFYSNKEEIEIPCLNSDTLEFSISDFRETSNESWGDNQNINHPTHYNQGKYEVIDVIEDWKLDFHESNAIKYIARAPHKENEIQDLNKAIWYLQRKVKKLEEEASNE